VAYWPLSTGNASVRREHVVAEGGFDPTYLRAEDVELPLLFASQLAAGRFTEFRLMPNESVL
jgi:hypothetical protein